MQANEGNLDRAVRITAGLALCIAAFAGVLGPWAWVGLVPLATGLVGTCPVYSIFGVNTCSLDRPGGGAR